MIPRMIAALIVTTVVTAACGPAVPPPATLDTAHDPCAYCRMIVSDRHFSAQIVAPLEEPKFFDDLGCLANYLKTSGQLPPRAVVYVADHSTLAWIPAHEAVFTRVDVLTAPMGSHVIAHESNTSRAADPAARSGTPIERQKVFPIGLPGADR
jgi:copper chaperone NosL